MCFAKVMTDAWETAIDEVIYLVRIKNARSGEVGENAGFFGAIFVIIRTEPSPLDQNLSHSSFGFQGCVDGLRKRRAGHENMPQQCLSLLIVNACNDVRDKLPQNRYEGFFPSKHRAIFNVDQLNQRIKRGVRVGANKGRQESLKISSCSEMEHL